MLEVCPPVDNRRGRHGQENAETDTCDGDGPLLRGDVPAGRWYRLPAPHESLGLGLPLPWLTIDVKYGRPIPSGDFYAQGPIEGIEGLGIDWISVPADLAAMLALSAMCVGVGKSGAGEPRATANAQ